MVFVAGELQERAWVLVYFGACQGKETHILSGNHYIIYCGGGGGMRQKAKEQKVSTVRTSTSTRRDLVMRLICVFFMHKIRDGIDKASHLFPFSPSSM